jgi:hypothetical protein
MPADALMAQPEKTLLGLLLTIAALQASLSKPRRLEE